MKIDMSEIKTTITVIDSDGPMDYLNDKVSNPYCMVSMAIHNMVIRKFWRKPAIKRTIDEIQAYERDCLRWFYDQGLI